MVLGVVILLLAGAIAYFHYVQGLFSSTLSAIVAIFAAVFAIAYHETVVDMLLKGRMADQAHAAGLVVMFAAVYVILRVVFDRFVPGNVRYPVLVDKIGAAIMGSIAALMATGVLVTAGQMLPFGPAIAGYSRWEVSDHTGVVIPNASGGQNTDGTTLDELKEAKLDPAKSRGLLIPVDDLVVGLTSKLSSGGALSGQRELRSVHPDWINELFGSRLGIQPGARRTALNVGGQDQAKLASPGIFLLDSVVAIDAEYKTVRGQALRPERGETITPDPSQALLVVRLNLAYEGTDEDKLMRLSTGAVRLVGVSSTRDGATYTNLYPLGTLEAGRLLYCNKPDDTIAVTLPDTAKDVDFVFLVPKELVFKESDPRSKELTIKSGVFVEVKRLARIDLSGTPSAGAPTPTPAGAVVRKNVAGSVSASGSSGTSSAGATSGAPSGTANRPSEGAAQAPADLPAMLTIADVKVQDTLFSPINVGQFSGDPANIEMRSGTATVTGKKFSKLSINTTDSIAVLSTGDFQLSELFVPAGRKMVQVSGTPTGSDAWKWAEDLRLIELVDGSGVKYKPNGAWAKLKVGTSDRMVARYDSESGIPDIAKEEGRPMDVWIVFNVPSGVKITDVLVGGKSVRKSDVAVP